VEYKITPYIEIDGIRTFPDSFIKGVYSRMVDEGSAPIVFSDGVITSSDAFMVYMKYRSYLFAIESDTDLAAVLWVDKILDKTCYAHFCGFNGSLGKGSVDIGRFAMNHVFGVKDDFDKPCFETVLGLIPSWNVIGVKWLKKVGLVEVGKIPNALWSEVENRSVEGTLLHITKEILGGLT
jgi:hypothetical protein